MACQKINPYNQLNSCLIASTVTVVNRIIYYIGTLVLSVSAEKVWNSLNGPFETEIVLFYYFIIFYNDLHFQKWFRGRYRGLGMVGQTL